MIKYVMINNVALTFKRFLVTNMWTQTIINKSKLSFNIFLIANIRIKEFCCEKHILNILQNKHNVIKDSYTENVLFILMLHD